LIGCKIDELGGNVDEYHTHRSGKHLSPEYLRDL